MAKEPRFVRRALSERIVQAIQNFPETTQEFMRNLSYMPSFYSGKGYVFLQIRVSGAMRKEHDYRAKRQTILEIACGAAKNKFPELKTIIGIAIDAPKFVNENSEDFILMECENWTEAQRAYYEEANKGWDFFQSSSLKQTYQKATEFIPAQAYPQQSAGRMKIGRNDPCTCGSSKKFKKCCGT